MILTPIFVFVVLAHTSSLLLLSWLSIRLARNLSFLRKKQQPSKSDHYYPHVSVLVPARNEEANIADCLGSLAQQDYPSFEVLVLDDQSTDNTWGKIEQLAVQHLVIQAFQGDSVPPSGWNGKSYACHRLAEQASGEWLLFTDADTYHTSRSISLGIEQAMQLEVDLLSVMPRQITKSWSERLMVPFIMDFLPLLGVDLQKMWRGESNHAVANGQYMFIRRKTYQAMGGHVTIRDALVDDFALTNHFLGHGQRVAFVGGASMLACRMYHNAGEVWHGFSKNIILSLQTTRQWPLWSIMLFAWGFASLFVLPYIIFFLHPNKLLAAIEIGWLMLLRLAVGRIARRPFAEAVFTPLAAIGVMTLGLNALMLKLRRQHITWKERPYPINQ